MPDRITRLVPVARRVTLGGRDYTAHEARIRDLAELQAWLDSGWPDPLGAIYPRLDAGIDGPDRDRMLHAAADRAEEGPPLWDDDRGHAELSTPGGVCAFLAVALRRGNPDLTVDDVKTIFDEMGHAEYAALRRVFYGVDPAAELNRMILGDEPRVGGDTLSWGEIVDELAAERGWTYGQIYDLTLSEFKNARRKGRPAGPAGIRVSFADLDRLRAARVSPAGESTGPGAGGG